MAKKKIEEDKEQVTVESVSPKEVSNFDFAQANEENKTVLDREPVVNEVVKEVSKAVEPTATPTKVNKEIPLGDGVVRKDKEFKVDKPEISNRQKRIDENAQSAIDAAAQWITDTGAPLSEESLASLLTPKQLWYFQKKYNKGSNWGNALGAREFLGELNNKTVQLINQKAKEQIDAKKAHDEAQSKFDKITYYGVNEDGTDKEFRVTKGMRDDMKNWGDTIRDINNISAEQATQLYDKLKSYGIDVPTKTVAMKDADGKDVVTEVYDISDSGNSLYSLLDNLGEEADQVIDVLGFDEGNGIQLPKHETFEEKLARQERAREELRHINEQRAIQRQQSRLGLAELAAGIGDMIKASGGAIVTPRDYKAMYDSLTAQQRANYDNYLARMQALKEQEKAKQKEAADRAYQEKMLATQHERDMEKLLQTQGFQAREAEKNRKHQSEEAESERIWRSGESYKQRSHEMDMLMKKLEAEAVDLEKKLGSEAAKNVTKGRKIYINNKELPASDDLYGELYAYFTTFSNRKYNTKDGGQAVLNFDKLKTEEFNTEDSKVAIALQVQKALRDFSNFNRDMQSDILSLILQTDTPISTEVGGNNVNGGLGRFGN